MIKLALSSIVGALLLVGGVTHSGQVAQAVGIVHQAQTTAQQNKGAFMTGDGRSANDYLNNSRYFNMSGN